MCESANRAQSPADALAAVTGTLSRLASVDANALTTPEQADCLRALERAESQLVAVRSAVLAAFTSSGGYEDDGTGGSRSWLRWQTQVTSGAAAGAMGWMRRLTAHRAVAAELATGSLSGSWARQLCDWTDALPEEDRASADGILLEAAAGGADLDDLGRLAEQMRRLTGRPDRDGDDDGFRDRRLRLDTHFRGTGKLDGDLTPDCAAALRAVLDSLNKKAGPEDLRSPGERDHDALAEACRRLSAGGLPDRAGQPTQIQLHMTLDQLLQTDGAGDVLAAWAGPGAPAQPGADCDAAIIPIVTGTLDADLLDDLAAQLVRDRVAGPGPASSTSGDSAASGQRSPDTSATTDTDLGATTTDSGVITDTGPAGPSTEADREPGTGTVSPGLARTAARELILSRAIRLLSGPAGLAAYLRHSLLPQPAASMSLPLDLGAATDTIPPWLRRAIISRDQHCQFVGCYQPPAACHVHHLTPRSEGGTTSLGNCALFCTFHHLIAIHRWGWQARLNSDATITTTAPDGRSWPHHRSVRAA